MDLRRCCRKALLGSLCFLGIATLHPLHAQVTTDQTPPPPATTPAAGTSPAIAEPPSAPNSGSATTSDSNAAIPTVTVDLPGAYTQTNTPEPKPASRVDLYGGYSFLKPSGSVGIYSECC